MNILSIPTYEHHFSCNIDFLNSMEKFCEDKNDQPIKFILCEHDIGKFNHEIKTKYPGLDIETVTLKNMIRATEGVDIDERDLIPKITKYSFQSLKKLYSVKYFSCDNCLVIDSENRCMKEFKFCSIFDDISENNTIFYSTTVPMDIQKTVTDNALKIIRSDAPRDKWMFDTCFWFFRRQIVDDMFRHVGDMMGLIMRHFPVFEAVLYHWFIFTRPGKYGVKFVNLLEKAERYFPGIKQRLATKHTAENIGFFLRQDENDALCYYLNDVGHRIFRMDRMHASLQKVSIEKTKVCIGNFHK